MFPLALLAIAGFTVVTTEFAIIGFLPRLAVDLEIGVCQAGLLVTLFAFTVAAAGPVVTLLLGSIPRKTLFVAILMVFGISNALAGLASDVRRVSVSIARPAKTKSA